jgi:hypothetical protein
MTFRSFPSALVILSALAVPAATSPAQGPAAPAASMANMSVQFGHRGLPTSNRDDFSGFHTGEKLRKVRLGGVDRNNLIH